MKPTLAMKLMLTVVVCLILSAVNALESIEGAIGFDPIYRGGGDGGPATLVLIETIPIYGIVYNFRMYAYQTIGPLDIWLFRQEGDDEKTLTPKFKKSLPAEGYTVGVNDIALDFPCQPGDRIGVTWYQYGVIDKQNAADWKYWVHGSASITIDTAIGFAPSYGYRFYSWRAFYSDYARRPIGTCDLTVEAVSRDKRIEDAWFVADYAGVRNLQTCMLHCSAHALCQGLSWHEGEHRCILGTNTTEPADVVGFVTYAIEQP